MPPGLRSESRGLLLTVSGPRNLSSLALTRQNRAPPDNHLVNLGQPKLKDARPKADLTAMLTVEAVRARISELESTATCLTEHLARSAAEARSDSARRILMKGMVGVDRIAYHLAGAARALQFAQQRAGGPNPWLQDAADLVAAAQLLLSRLSRARA